MPIADDVKLAASVKIFHPELVNLCWADTDVDRVVREVRATCERLAG